MNLNPNDSTTSLLNAEIARRDTLPPFVRSDKLPEAFLGMQGAVARVCAWHGRTHEEQKITCKLATDWALAHGWSVTHGMCPECAAREMAAARRPLSAA